jgi:DNA repair photolyase
MKNTVQYKNITCKSALNKVKGGFPYKWDLNIYRGCIHNCKYCYALYSHKYINSSSDDFFNEIYIKTNIVEELDRQLNSKSWKNEVINIGGVTDSYQIAEKDNKIMPEILKLLIKHKNPAIISTKSELILRDFDLIDELSRITYINIASTITVTDRKTASMIETNASSPAKRFNILKTFRKTNASVGMHSMPIIPFITDSIENIESLFYYAKESDVHYVLPGILYLRGETRKSFFNFILHNYPELYKKIYMLYNNNEIRKEYKIKLYGNINSIKKKYSISFNYTNPMKDKIQKKQKYDPQLKLF